MPSSPLFRRESSSPEPPPAKRQRFFPSDGDDSSSPSTCADHRPQAAPATLTLDSSDAEGSQPAPASSADRARRVKGRQVEWESRYFGGPSPFPLLARSHCSQLTLLRLPCRGLRRGLCALQLERVRQAQAGRAHHPAPPQPAPRQRRLIEHDQRRRRRVQAAQEQETRERRRALPQRQGRRGRPHLARRLGLARQAPRP